MTTRMMTVVKANSHWNYLVLTTILSIYGWEAKKLNMIRELLSEKPRAKNQVYVTPEPTLLIYYIFIAYIS